MNNTQFCEYEAKNLPKGVFPALLVEFVHGDCFENGRYYRSEYIVKIPAWLGGCTGGPGDDQTIYGLAAIGVFGPGQELTWKYRGVEVIDELKYKVVTVLRGDRHA